MFCLRQGMHKDPAWRASISCSVKLIAFFRDEESGCFIHSK